jgi:hypothetical protein
MLCESKRSKPSHESARGGICYAYKNGLRAVAEAEAP